MRRAIAATRSGPHPDRREQEITISLDPRSALVVDVHDVSRQPGTMRSFQRTAPAPAELGTPVIRVPEGSPLDIDMRVESVMEGVLISGTIHAQAVGECVRCLDPVTVDVDEPFTVLFAYPDRAQAIADARGEEADEDDDDVAVLEGDLADLEGVVRDTVIPGLPLRPLCRQDCPGLCPQCGARLADDPGHRHDNIDPRWSALHDLLAEADNSTETKES